MYMYYNKIHKNSCKKTICIISYNQKKEYTIQGERLGNNADYNYFQIK